MKILNIANLVTAVRFVLGLIAVYFLIINENIITLVLFLIFLFLDFLDGFLARKFGCESTFGKNFDFFTDVSIVLLLGIVLFYRGIISLLYIFFTLFLLPIIPRYRNRPATSCSNTISSDRCP